MVRVIGAPAPMLTIGMLVVAWASVPPVARTFGTIAQMPQSRSAIMSLQGSDDDSAALSPSSMLQEWRTTRLSSFASAFDASRYHVQVLFVDDDGSRARTCEALLERVSLWADAGWWIYPHSASINNVAEGSAPPPSLLTSDWPSSLGLCRTRLGAPAAKFDVSDLVSYDLIICADLGVRQQVRAMALGSSGSDSDSGDEDPLPNVLCVTDFLACGGERMDTLDEPMRSFLAPHFQRLTAGGGLVDLPDSFPSRGREWEAVVAACLLSMAGLTVFLKERIDSFFVDAFNELLATHYTTADALDALTSDEVDAELRRYQVTGGLSVQQRQDLIGVHKERLRGLQPD